MTKEITVGKVKIGGGAPVSIQSMTTTKTEDFEATSAQINALASAGCDIVRVAVPDMAAAGAIDKIKERINVPLVADIHFNASLAVCAAERGADKIRINPGNIGSEDGVRAVIDVCRARCLPIRIGVNGGSMEKDLLEKFGGVTPEGLAESAMRHVRILEKYGFTDICISAKASDTMTTIKTYRLLSQMTDYPLHLGVTEAGTEYGGIIRSAAALGALLSEGIGDTIRISLTADPVREIVAAKELLRALGMRKSGVRVVSCPTCGRCNIDLISLASEVEKRLEGVDKAITVAVMGCAVNGPGEAREADFGIAGGKDEGLLFKHGEIIGKAPYGELADRLMKMIEEST